MTGKLIGFALSISLAAFSIPAYAGSKTAPSDLLIAQRGNIALYITMHDGVRIAADIWFPKGSVEGARFPAVMETTRYWRATRKGNRLSPNAQALVAAGYAYLSIDARGSGASFGNRRMEWAPEEVADLRDIVDWIVAQPWSNGKVGGVGTSYSGNMAELLAASGHPAVKAVAPLYSDFDPASFLPGGVKVTGFLEPWITGNAALDRNDMCALAKIAHAPCFLAKAMIGGVKPVDGPDGERLLNEAVAEHSRNFNLRSWVVGHRFSDERSATGLTLEDVAPYHYRAQIEAAGVPMFVRVGWFDGNTVAGALGRFNTFSNVQKLSIGPYSHGGKFNTDPFKDRKAKIDPTPAAQSAELVRFFDCYMKPDTGNDHDLLCNKQKSINYSTMGREGWRSTTRWPLSGTRSRRLFLNSGGGLSAEQSAGPSAQQQYRVDMSTTTGRTNRWATQNGGGDVVYDNRQAQSAKMTSFASAPLAADTEITGQPVIALRMMSDMPDGTIHAYLEDVGPDGAITYLTEGVVRLSQRRVTKSPPYWLPAPALGTRSTDSAPMPAGGAEDISFTFFPISAMIRAGHRIRISLAGADIDFYERVPAEGTPTYTFFLGGEAPSYVDLPVVGP